jgi:hypothetical protein
MMKGETELEQVAKIEYVHEDMQRVRTLTDRQRWSYDKEANAWWLQTGLPELR